MPIYKFFCKECDSEIEEIKTIKESEEFKICPNCKEPTLIKLLGNFNSVYITGSRFVKPKK